MGLAEGPRKHKGAHGVCAGQVPEADPGHVHPGKADLLRQPAQRTPGDGLRRVHGAPTNQISGNQGSILHQGDRQDTARPETLHGGGVRVPAVLVPAVAAAAGHGRHAAAARLHPEQRAGDDEQGQLPGAAALGRESGKPAGAGVFGLLAGEAQLLQPRAAGAAAAGRPEQDAAADQGAAAAGRGAGAADGGGRAEHPEAVRLLLQGVVLRQRVRRAARQAAVRLRGADERAVGRLPGEGAAVLRRQAAQPGADRPVELLRRVPRGPEPHELRPDLHGPAVPALRRAGGAHRPGLRLQPRRVPEARRAVPADRRQDALPGGHPQQALLPHRPELHRRRPREGRERRPLGPLLRHPRLLPRGPQPPGGGGGVHRDLGAHQTQHGPHQAAVPQAPLPEGHPERHQPAAARHPGEHHDHRERRAPLPGPEVPVLRQRTRGRDPDREAAAGLAPQGAGPLPQRGERPAAHCQQAG